ncbi:hypothetical protein DFH09DRAFT_1271477 [Mycena vulgaris]|nr:hypothetical protein DFH09DRAFT_1271477 [Mycena vulgaris]
MLPERGVWTHTTSTDPDIDRHHVEPPRCSAQAQEQAGWTAAVKRPIRTGGIFNFVSRASLHLHGSGMVGGGGGGREPQASKSPLPAPQAIYALARVFQPGFFISGMVGGEAVAANINERACSPAARKSPPPAPQAIHALAAG